MIALAIELRRRRHSCLISSWEGYRKKVIDLGFEFHSLRPDARRAGVAEIIRRDKYTSESASRALDQILTNPKYRQCAAQLKGIVNSENGTVTPCDAIELILRK